MKTEGRTVRTLACSEASMSVICKLTGRVGATIGSYLWQEEDDHDGDDDSAHYALPEPPSLMQRALALFDDASPGSMVRKRSYFTTMAIASELRRLHADRRTAFEPDNIEEHEQLLRRIWGALRSDDFQRCGEGWKEVGFQGADPVTDVRAGGLLAIRAITEFATLQTHGFRQMLAQVAHAAAKSPDHYYPTCCTAVVCCAALCDALGISRGMRGAIPDEELPLLLAAAPTSPLSAFLTAPWSSWALGRRGGFLGLFSLLFADFHARWYKFTVGYMQTQELLAECTERLSRRAERVSQSGGFRELREAYTRDAEVPEVAQLLGERRELVSKMRAAAESVRVLNRLHAAAGISVSLRRTNAWLTPSCAPPPPASSTSSAPPEPNVKGHSVLDAEEQV